MEGTSSPTSREARRRRIVERGSDRLALISGRIKTLPSENESPRAGSDNPRGHSYTASCPPSMTHSQLPAVNNPSDFQDTLQREDNSLGSLSTNNRSGPEIDNYIFKSEIISEASKSTINDSDSKGQSSEIIPTIQSPNTTNHHSEQPSSFPQTKTLTFTEVSVAFKATEAARLHCSLAIAVSVVLSYIGFPILGSRLLGSLILFRPLCLLLLTNITIAMSQLLEKQQQEGGLQKTEHHDNGLVDHLGSALEIVFMLQNVSGALIMDCSIYVIIVICGLSLAQALGW